MLVDCKCGAVNRLPADKKVRARCGKCKHVFGIQELLRGRHEKPPVPVEEPMTAGVPEGFDLDGLDLDTATDEDLIEILLNGRGQCKGWSPFDNGLPLAPVREELVKEIIPRLRRKCFPKVQHPTRGAAETQLHDVLHNKLAKDVSRIHTYHCPECGQWHVGHSTPRRV